MLASFLLALASSLSARSPLAVGHCYMPSLRSFATLVDRFLLGPFHIALFFCSPAFLHCPLAISSLTATDRHRSRPSVPPFSYHRSPQFATVEPSVPPLAPVCHRCPQFATALAPVRHRSRPNLPPFAPKCHRSRSSVPPFAPVGSRLPPLKKMCHRCSRFATALAPFARSLSLLARVSHRPPSVPTFHPR